MPILAAIIAQLGPTAASMAFNLLILVLQKTGVLNSVEVGAVDTERALANTVSHLKTYSQPDDFPQGKNGA